MSISKVSKYSTPFRKFLGPDGNLDFLLGFWFPPGFQCQDARISGCRQSTAKSFSWNFSSKNFVHCNTDEKFVNVLSNGRAICFSLRFVWLFMQIPVNVYKSFPYDLRNFLCAKIILFFINLPLFLWRNCKMLNFFFGFTASNQFPANPSSKRLEKLCRDNCSRRRLAVASIVKSNTFVLSSVHSFHVRAQSLIIE